MRTFSRWVAGLAIGVCGALGTACGDTPENTTGSVGTTSPPRRPPETLAGETAEQANERIIRECYEEFGVSMGEPGPDGGVPISAAPAVLSEAIEICNQRLVDAGLQGDVQLTPEEHEANYRRIAAWRDCMEDQGFDLPDIVGLDAYITSDGTADVFAGIEALMTSLTAAQRDELAEACPQS